MKNPTAWWPTPHDPSRWFSNDELRSSRRYNLPVRRVAVARAAAQIALLVVGQWLLLERSGVGLSAETPWLVRFGAGVAVIVLAWWIPTTVADTWFEYRHEPRVGHRPLPVRRFMVGLGASLLGAALGVSGLAALFLLGVRLFGDLWWLGGVLAVVLGSVAMGLLGPRLSRLATNYEPLDGSAFAGLTKNLDVTFVRMAAETNPGPNAMAMGWRRVTIAMTPDLLEAEDELQAHVVAHELSHVRHRDAMATMIITALTEAATLIVVARLVASDAVVSRLGQLEAGFGITDPRALPIVVAGLVLSIVACRPFLAWLSRAHERRADLDAHRLVGPTPEWALRTLHVTSRGDLDPPRWVRFFLSHPAPAERLELARRAQRA